MCGVVQNFGGSSLPKPACQHGILTDEERREAKERVACQLDEHLFREQSKKLDPLRFR
jgi:hypothetical protein